MAITAVSVEANGWVLAITCTGTLTSPNSNFGAYVMSPDAAPRVGFSVTSPGFVKSAGTAVAGSQTRAIIGTTVLRKPVDPLVPLVKVIDETDLGGGLVQVRIALSEEVHATDTVGTLTVLAGWRAGEGAASGIAITNASTLTAPLPIMRWVLPPYDVATGPFRVSLIVGSVYPVGFEPVAGVRFTATDGTTVKSVWATSLSTDNSYGDNLRCYSVLIDPATATALTAGLLRIDAEVYPWVGAMRSTDTAGTRPMTTLRTDGFRTSASSPWVIGYDPAGSRYSQQWAYVDPVSGTTTAAVGMVATTLAGAKAIAPASRPRDVATALAAVGLVNRSLAAANGQAAATRAADGARIVLAPGVHTGLGTTVIASTMTTTEIPPMIVGDPDDGNPRVNCIIDTSTTSLNTRSTRLRWRNLTVRAGSAALQTSVSVYQLFDNIEIVGRSGSETVTTAPFIGTAAPAGLINWHLTGTRIWRTGFSIGAANRQAGLVRACAFSRRVTGIVFVRNSWISKAADGFTSTNTSEGMGTVVQSTDLGSFEDVVVAYNDMRSMRYGVWNAGQAPAALTGLTPQAGSHRRHLILNNLAERISTTAGVTPTSDAFFGYGEGQYVLMDTIVIEGNTFAGGGYNAFYSDPTPVTLADINSQTNITRRIRHANNATDRNASKHDDFSDPNTSTIRTANGVNGLAGYRPACIGGWSVHYGVGMEGHVDCGRKGRITDFRREYAGLRGVQFAVPTAPGWTSDRSEAGNDLGGGDYVPAAGSVFLNRISRANSDRDLAGVGRLANGAAGAFEASVSPSLAPDAGRSAHSAALTSVGISFGVTPAGTSHGQMAAASAVTIVFMLTASDARHGHSGGAAAADWSAILGPASAVSASFSTEPEISNLSVGTLLAPDGAGHSLGLGPTFVFPDSASFGGGTLEVPAEARTLSVQ